MERTNWLSISLILLCSLALAGCNGDLSSSSSSDSDPATGGAGGADGNGQSNTDPQDNLLTIARTENDLTLAFCPEAAEETAANELIDPALCRNEVLERVNEQVDLAEIGIAARFCPTTAEDELLLIAIDEGAFPTSPDDFDDFDPENLVRSNAGEFFQSCIQESDEAMMAVAPLLEASNVVAGQFCPNEANRNEIRSDVCFGEGLNATFGSLPGVSGFPNPTDTDAVMEAFDPDQFQEDLANLPDDFQELPEQLQALLTDLAGAFIPEGDDGDDGDFSAPGFDDFAGQFCPGTIENGDVGPTTPFDCLQEAGGNLDQVTELLGQIGQPNPLTEAVCPMEHGTGDIDPQGCITEALSTLGDGAPGGDFDGIPVLSDLFAALLGDDEDNGDSDLPGFEDIPGFAEACGDAGDPVTCLLTAGGNFGALEDLLATLEEGAGDFDGDFGDDNPLAFLCDDFTDPAGCFMSLLDPSQLPGGDNDGDDSGVPEELEQLGGLLVLLEELGNADDFDPEELTALLDLLSDAPLIGDITDGLLDLAP